MQVTVWTRGTKRVYEANTSGIGAAFVSDFGELLEVEFSTRYGTGFAGHDLASWTIRPYGGLVGGLFRPGDHVRITKGGGTCFEGEFSETEPHDDGTVTMRAKGYAYNMYDYDSMKLMVVVGPDNDLFYPTTNFVTGIDYARTQLGFPILTTFGTVPTGNFGATDVGKEFIKLGDLLTALLTEVNKKWAVWGRVLVIAADDMVPIWSYDAPEGVFAVADTDYATHLFLWYVRTTPPTTIADYMCATATDTLGVARFDVRTAGTDYRGLGLMTTARADALAASLLAQVKGRFLFTGSITVGTESGFKTIGGGKADLAFVRAGRAMTLPGLRSGQGNLTPEANTFMIGQTDYRWSIDGEESLTVTPMGAVPRNVASILAAPEKPTDAGETVAG